MGKNFKASSFFFHNKKTFIEIEHPNRSVNLGTLKFSLKTLKHILSNNKGIHS